MENNFKTDAEESLTDIKGKELDVHHVMLEYKGDGTKIEAELLKLIAGKDLPNSQFFILLGDRDMRVGGYAILELHKTGESNRDLLENSVIPMEKELFSSYHIVD